MSKVVLKFGLEILMLVLGAFISHFISKKFFKEEAKTTVLSGDKIIFKQTQIQIKNEIHNTHYKTETKTTSRSSNSTSSSSNDEIWGIFAAIFIATLFAIFGYLKFRAEIYLTIRLLSLFTLSLLLTSIYSIKKNNVQLDETFYSIIVTTALSLLVVQGSIYFADNPLFFETISKAEILKSMENNGFFSLLTEYGVDIWGHLLYQLTGLLFSFVLLLLQISGVLYILALLRYAFNYNMNFLWRFIYKHTHQPLSKPFWYIAFSLFLAVLSIVLTSGFAASFLANNPST